MTLASPVPVADRRGTTVTRWMRNPAIDAMVAFAWIPVFVLAHRWAASPAALISLTSTVLLVSFCHQPVTLPLMYGDIRERRRRGLFLVIAPVVVVALVYLGLLVSLVLVAVVSGLWNAHHTMRQRYGLLRVYGRKAGQDDGRHEQAMLLWWFGAALFVSLAGDSLTERLERLPLGRVNREVVGLLRDVRPAATVLAAIVVGGAVVETVRWVRLERRRPVRNRAKYLYLAGASTLFLLGPIDPVAVFLGFMSAHSIEYFVVVEQTLPKRALPGSVLGRIVDRRGGAAVFLATYVGLILALVAVLRDGLPGRFFFAIYLSFGVLHFVYDSMIWRLRRPAVAAQFEIATEPVG